MIDILEARFVTDLIRISEAAGRAIMDVYDKGAQVDVRLKSDDSPLTLADQRANEIIVQELKALYPNIPIISEENRQLSFEERQGFKQYWVVDPLDGTKEFIKRNGEFTVNIALCENHRPVAGFVFLPVTGEIYYAVRGLGAYKGDQDNKDRLEAARFSLHDAQLTVVVSRSHLNEATEQYLATLNEPKTLASGSSLKFIRIAEGRAHLYPRFGPTMEWDTAAAQIILEEAGGSVVTVDSEQALTYNKENLLNPYFIALGRLTHA